MRGFGRTGLLAIMLLGSAAPAGAQPIGAGGPATVQPDEQAELQWAAGVSEVHSLAHQGDADVTLFGLVGGDPAMNGEYVYLSFNGPPSEGSKIFKIGDVLAFHILSDSPGRLLLQVQENILRGSEIGTQTRRVLVTWTPGRDGAPPTSVRVATAPSVRAAPPARRPAPRPRR